jgi:RAC serine/threonine-protein kinase
VFLYELLTGLTPFCPNPRMSNYEIYLKILEVKIRFPKHVDQESRDLIQALCHPNLAKRLVDPNLIKSSSYFNIPWEDVYNRKLIPPFVPKINLEEEDDHYFDMYDPPNKYQVLSNDQKKYKFIGF